MHQGKGFGFHSFATEMWTKLRRNYCLWPVAAFAVIGPCFATYVSYRKLQGPDVTFTVAGKDHEKHNAFENRKYRIYELTPFDYANYKHPRPRF